ncbi:MAG TPA: hypothetical protein P5328_02815 [Candidatus Paceibacterota bacterium]|nr:hypothetical protein [Candidatus Paceibacterota bacterium]HRZ34372.1 hypothetical protein [Candidatus Paceibacterota bacterium]
MIPLSRKTRRRVFLILLLVFILLAPVILARSLGYRLEQLEDIFTLVKMGGIYLHSDVVGTQIYLDGKYVEKSGLLLRNTLIQDLKPEREYKVTVVKDGMHSWEKTLAVYPGVVTEARVLMLPTEIASAEIYPFTDKNGMGTTTPQTFVSIQNGIPTNPEYLNLQKLFKEATTTPEQKTIASAKNAVSTTTNIKSIPKYFSELGVSDPDALENLIIRGDSVLWLSDGKVLVHWVSEDSVAPYYYCLDFTKCREVITVSLDEPIISFDFLPGRDDVLVALTSGGLFAVEIDDRSERNIQPVYLGENLEFRIDSKDQIVILDSDIFSVLRF